MKLNTLPCFPNLFWFQTFPSQQLVSSSIWCYKPVIIFDSLPFPPSWDPFSVVHLFLLKKKKKKKTWFFSASPDFRLVQSTITSYVACATPTVLVSIFTLSNSFCTEWSVWLFANINVSKNAASLYKTFQLLPIITPRKVKTCIIVYKFLNNLWLLVTS